MLLRFEESEAHTETAMLVGWCGGERLADKQSVTGPLSQVGTEGHAYSRARDKVSHDETDKQHWWRLYLISLCSPSCLLRCLICLSFPFTGCIHTFCTTSSVNCSILFCRMPFGLFKYFCLRAVQQMRGLFFSLMRANRQYKRQLFLPTFTHAQTHREQQPDLKSLPCTSLLRAQTVSKPATLDSHTVTELFLSAVSGRTWHHSVFANS